MRKHDVERPTRRKTGGNNIYSNLDDTDGDQLDGIEAVRCRCRLIEEDESCGGRNETTLGQLALSLTNKNEIITCYPKRKWP